MHEIVGKRVYLWCVCVSTPVCVCAPMCVCVCVCVCVCELSWAGQRDAVHIYSRKCVLYSRARATSPGRPPGTCDLRLPQGSPARHSTAQHSTAQHSTAQHSTAQHSTAEKRERERERESARDW